MDNPTIIFTIFVLLVGLFATAGYGLMSVAQYRAARVAFVLAAFFFAAIGVELGLVMVLPLPAKIVVAGCFGFVAAGALVYVFSSISLLEKPKAVSTGFYIECQQQIGSIKISPEGLYFIQVSEMGGGGLGHLPVTDPSQIGQDYKILNDKIIEALRCKVSNYEALPALDVTLSFKASFRKVDKHGIVVLPGDIVAERMFHINLSPLIGKIDPGGANAVTFYITNRSQESGVTFIFSNTISARLLTEDKVRSFELRAAGTAPMLLPERPMPK